MHYYLLG